MDDRIYSIGEQLPISGQTPTESRHFKQGYTKGHLESDFSFREPWGADIVTNNSEHRYRVSGDTLRDPFVLDSRGLVIQASKLHDPVDVERNSGRHWVSGVLDGYGSPFFRLNEGQAMTARIKLPEGNAFWPAFWGLPEIDLNDWPDDYEDTKLPEFDVVERVARYMGKNVFRVSSHSYNEPTHTGTMPLTSQHDDHECPPSIDFTSQFHNFTVMRTNQQVVTALDDNIVSVRPKFVDTIMNGTWVMMLNIAVGGTWPGATDEDTPDLGELCIESITKHQCAVDINGPNKDLIRDLEELRASVLGCVNDKFDTRRRVLL